MGVIPRTALGALLVLCTCSWLAAAPQPAEPSQHDILPILQLRCTACHGVGRQVAELDLRTIDSIHKGGVSGPAVVPGDPDKSPLVRRMADGLCPPNTQLLDFGVKLPTPAEVDRVRRWVAAGAPRVEVSIPAADAVSDVDRAFWAFQPPRASDPPSVT